VILENNNAYENKPLLHLLSKSYKESFS